MSENILLFILNIGFTYKIKNTFSVRAEIKIEHLRTGQRNKMFSKGAVQMASCSWKVLKVTNYQKNAIKTTRKNLNTFILKVIIKTKHSITPDTIYWECLKKF